MIEPLDLTPEQIDELNMYKKALVTVLEDEDLPEWSKLSNGQKKFVIESMNKIVEEVVPESARLYSLVYTIKDEAVELMAIPKEEAAKFIQ